MGTTTINIFVLSLAIISLPVIATSHRIISNTFNRNFNVQPHQIAERMSSLPPKYIRQGSKIYLNPQIQLPLDILPPHISALLASIHQGSDSVFMLGGDGVTGIGKPIESRPAINDAINVVKISEIPESVELINSVPESEILFEKNIFVPLETIQINEGIFETVKIDEKPIIEPIEPSPVEITVNENFDIHDKNEAVIQELEVMPEAPVLPANYSPLINEQEVNEIPISKPIQLLTEVPKPEPIIVVEEDNLPVHDEPATIIEELVPIPEPPILPPLSIDVSPTDITQVVNDIPIPSPIYKEPEPVVQELVVLPEPPVLPPLTINIHSPAFEEEIRQMLISAPVEVSAEIPIIEVPVEDKLDLPPLPLPIYNNQETVIEELVPIPETPINVPPTIITEEVNESPIELLELPIPKPIEVIVEDNVSESANSVPTVYDEPEVIIQELITVPEVPKLPSLSVNRHFSPTIVKQGVIELLPTKPIEVIAEESFGIPTTHGVSETIIQELVTIPEEPVLPQWSLTGSPAVIEEENETERVIVPYTIKITSKPILLEESMAVFPTKLDITKQAIQPIEAVPEISKAQIKLNLKTDVVQPVVHNSVPKVVPINKNLPYKVQNNGQHWSLVPLSKFNMQLKSNLGKRNRIASSTSCARDIVTKRIAPNIMMTGQSPKLFKLVPVQTALKAPVNKS